MSKRGEIHLIIGPMYSGKCLAEDTEILLYDGSVKKVQDIQVGDYLMGNDFSPRKVLGTCCGEGKLYKIEPYSKVGIPYIVNEDHILSLKCYEKIKYRKKQKLSESNEKKIEEGEKKEEEEFFNEDDILNISVAEYYENQTYLSNYFGGYSVIGIDFPERDSDISAYVFAHYLVSDYIKNEDKINSIPRYYINNSREIRIKFLSGIIDALVRDNSSLQKVELQQGYKNRSIQHYRCYFLNNCTKLNDFSICIIFKLMIPNVDNESCNMLLDIIRLFAKSLGFAFFHHRQVVFNKKKYEITSLEIHSFNEDIVFSFMDYSRSLEIEENTIITSCEKLLLLADACEICEPLIVTLHSEKGKYYGFELTGNHLFLLNDYTVTHNSSELIRLIKRFNIANKKTVIVKYSKDTRYTTQDVISTHDKLTKEAVSATTLTEAIAKINNDPKYKDFEVIAIDEGQFFPDLISVSENLANSGKIVLIAALNGNFKRESFKPMLNIYAIADNITYLSAICQDCGQEAHYSKRITDEQEEEVIGGSDKYKAVCRNCYFS